MKNWFLHLADFSDLFHDAPTNTISLMGTLKAHSCGADDKLRYPLPYSVEDYIWFQVPKIDARWFAIMPLGSADTLRVGYEQRETTISSWYKG